MRKYKAFLSTLLFCLTGWAAYGQGPSWKVEIKPEQTAVKSKQDFSVATAVRNIAKGEQSLYVLDCLYPGHWSTDNPAVNLIVINCAQNSLATFRLKPGEAHESALPVFIELAAGSARHESVTFRLRYAFANSLGTSAPGTVPPPIWSNPVTVEVSRASTSSK